jgi:hypothetical protein
MVDLDEVITFSFWGGDIEGDGTDAFDLTTVQNIVVIGTDLNNFTGTNIFNGAPSAEGLAVALRGWGSELRGMKVWGDGEELANIFSGATVNINSVISSTLRRLIGRGTGPKIVIGDSGGGWTQVKVEHDLEFGEGTNNRSLSPETRSTNVVGRAMTVKGGDAGSGATGVGGGGLIVQGGDADGTTGDADGGDIFVGGGSPVNSGTEGDVMLAQTSAPAQRGAVVTGLNGTAIKKIAKVSTVAIDPGSIAATTRGTATGTLTGAAAGDAVVAIGIPSGLDDDLIYMGADISAGNTVRIYLYNPTGGAIDDGSNNWDFLWWDVT